MSTRSRSARLAPGSAVVAREVETVRGERVSIPDVRRVVHLQFRRFAGCPVCNLHLRSFAARHGELEDAGVHEVVVFHSPADELRRHAEHLPFATVADPEKSLYREFGVESAVRSLLDPRAWLPIVTAVARTLWGVLFGNERLPRCSHATRH